MFNFGKKEVIKTTVEQEYDALAESLASYAGDSEEYGKTVEHLGALGDEKRKEAEFNKQNGTAVKGWRKVLDLITDPKVWAAGLPVIGGIFYAEFCDRRSKKGDSSQPDEMRNYRTKW